MKLFLQTVISVFLFLSVTLAGYSPSQVDVAIVDKLEPLLIELHESSHDEFKQIHVFLSNKRFYFASESRRSRLVEELFAITFAELTKPRDPLIEESKKIVSIPEIKPISLSHVLSKANKEILMKHTPSYIAEKDILIIEFTDLECPFCERLHNSRALSKIDNDFDQIWYLTLSFPLSFHKQATPAAVAASCIQKYAWYDAYKRFIDSLFWRDDISELEIFLSLQLIIEENFIQDDEIVDCFDNNETLKAVEEQQALWQSLWVTWTPWTIILEQSSWTYTKIAGVYPEQHFRDIVDEVINWNWESFAKRVDGPPVPFPKDVAIQGKRSLYIDSFDHEEFLETAYIQWNSEAPVSIIEFSDVQCPFCQRHTNNGTLNSVQEIYGDDVNIIYGHFPLSFHQHAQKAGEALECVWKMWGEELFRKFKDSLYAAWGNSNGDIIESVAVDLWIDIHDLLSCVDSGEFTQKVKTQMSYGQSLGVTWTPWNIVVNNITGQIMKISGAVPAASFDNVIEDFLWD